MTAQGADAVPVELIVLAVAVGVAAVALLVLLARRGAPRRPPAAPRCGACGSRLRAGLAACPSCGRTPAPPLGAVELLDGPQKGQVFDLTSDVTTVGSIAGNTIVVADPEVAKKHIGIRRDPVGYELADLGSMNGVFVNGQRMAKRLLASGDIIRLGTSEMVFRIGKVG
jgi:hypothetical protein